MDCKIHENAIGIVFQVTIQDCDTNAAVRLENAITKQVHFKKPDGSTIIRNCDFVTDGADGKIEYITIAGDLNLTGIWRVQYFVDLPTISTGTSMESFEVEPNLF